MGDNEVHELKEEGRTIIVNVPPGALVTVGVQPYEPDRGGDLTGYVAEPADVARVARDTSGPSNPGHDAQHERADRVMRRWLNDATTELRAAHDELHAAQQRVAAAVRRRDEAVAELDAARHAVHGS